MDTVSGSHLRLSAKKQKWSKFEPEPYELFFSIGENYMKPLHASGAIRSFQADESRLFNRSDKKLKLRWNVDFDSRISDGSSYPDPELWLKGRQQQTWLKKSTGSWTAGRERLSGRHDASQPDHSRRCQGFFWIYALLPVCRSQE